MSVLRSGALALVAIGVLAGSGCATGTAAPAAKVGPAEPPGSEMCRRYVQNARRFGPAFDETTASRLSAKCLQHEAKQERDLLPRFVHHCASRATTATRFHGCGIDAAHVASSCSKRAGDSELAFTLCVRQLLPSLGRYEERPPPPDTICRNCAYDGRCHRVRKDSDRCIAASDTLCARSTNCRHWGDCVARTGRCRPSTNGHCAAALLGCKRGKRCRLEGTRCTAKVDGRPP